MQVLKFGGTSVGSPQRMKEVAQLIDDGQSKVIVLSAVSGTTNKLVSIAGHLLRKDRQTAREELAALRSEYQAFVEELFAGAAVKEQALSRIWQNFRLMEGLAQKEFTPVEEKILLAQGELMSTELFQLYLQDRGVQAIILPALAFMRMDENNEPDLTFLKEELTELLEENSEYDYFITQGYICRNVRNEIDNLQRGGSDYTATLIGAALQVEEIQIWTDIDGIHNNDPRVVKNTFPLRNASYREAAELAYFGAKILHPTCVIPAERAGVPIRLKNTFSPIAPGTLISSRSSGRAITALAAKDGITAIKIRSGRMLNAYGFLRKVFEVFEQFKTPIDMITTSEVSVSLTIDDNTYLDAIVGALEPFGEVSCEKDQSIICIVGDLLSENSGYTRQIFTGLEDIPIRMVSYGGSKNNISILVSSEYKEDALRKLHQHLFKNIVVTTV